MRSPCPVSRVQLGQLGQWFGQGYSWSCSLTEGWSESPVPSSLSLEAPCSSLQRPRGHPRRMDLLPSPYFQAGTLPGSSAVGITNKSCSRKHLGLLRSSPSFPGWLWLVSPDLGWLKWGSVPFRLGPVLGRGQERKWGFTHVLSRYCDDSQHSHHFRRQRELNIAHLVLEEHPKRDLSSISPGFLLIDFLKTKIIYLFDWAGS